MGDSAIPGRWRGAFCRFRLVELDLGEFGDQLGELLTLAVAHVQEADSDGVLVEDCLAYSCEAEGKAVEVELGFDADEDTDTEGLIGTKPASTMAEVEDSPAHCDAALYQP